MSTAPPRGRVLAQGRYITFLDDGGWEYVTRPRITGIVVLVAITPEREVVLVEQHRRPVANSVIELPAGLVGDVPGQEAESLAVAAHRELVEETGFEARGLRRVGPGGGDDSEDIVVHLVSLATLDAFLEGKRAAGIAVDPKIFAGLYLVGEKRPR